MKLTLSLSLVVLFSCSALAQQCSAVFQFGLYDINAAEGSEQQAQSFSNWFCSHKSNAQQAEQSFGLKFDKLDINFGNSNGGTTVDEACGNSSKNEQFRRAFSQFSQTINSAIVDAYKNCINVKGAHVWLETTADPQLVRLATIFNPSSKNDPVALVRSFDVVNGACSPKLTAGAEIDVAGRSILCKRTNAQTPITININLDHTIVDATGALSLPGLPVIVPPTQPSLIDFMMNGNPVYLVTNSKPNTSICIGSILGDSAYTIVYTRHNRGWIGKGPHGDGKCPTQNRDFMDNATYNCANFPTLCDETPQKHLIVLWGHGFRFSDDGKVFEALPNGREAEVGQILKDPQPANFKVFGIR